MKKMKPPSGSQKATKSSTDKAKVEAATQRKHSGDKTGAGKPLSRTSKPLSKSQDNLASTLRRKAAAASLATPNKAGGTPVGGTKEKGTSGSKFKSPKPPPAGPLTKAASAHNVNTAELPMKRAQSVQLIADGASTMSKNTVSGAVKRAQSTQNVSRDRSESRQRISAPVNAMAYNAELLASFEKEKRALERRISELIQTGENRLNEIERLKFENRNLREAAPAEQLKETLDLLTEENVQLKDRLRALGVTFENASDAEKLSLLSRGGSQSGDGLATRSVDGLLMHSTRSADGLLVGEGHRAGSDVDETKVHDRATLDTDLGMSVGDLSCMTPDHPSTFSLDNGNWDRQSNKSNISDAQSDVACLQDRILQMEETHYSQSEELQATLQELGDLQDALNTVTQENECLADEKAVLLESLCAQTEKLENARMQIEHLKALMVRESETGDRSENEKQLVALVKSSQEERDELYLKQVELTNSMHASHEEIRELQDVIIALKDKITLLEMRHESQASERRQVDTQLSELREQLANQQVETQHYRTLLEHEKTKVDELQQARNLADKSEMETLLDQARLEKEKVEGQLTEVQDDLAHSRNEVTKLKEQLSSLEEELTVSKNNYKSLAHDLEYAAEQRETEKLALQDEVNALHEHMARLQHDMERQREAESSQTTLVGRLEADLAAANQHIQELQHENREVRRRLMEEQEEWKQFQTDLQTAVVVANDIKTEAQEEQEKLLQDLQAVKEQNRAYQADIELMQEELDKIRQKEDIRSDLRGRVISTVDRELAALRGRKQSEIKGGSQTFSVKNIIASIEQQVKGTTSTPPLSPSGPIVPPSQESSRRNSAECVLSISGYGQDSLALSPVDRRSSTPADSHIKSLLRKPSDSKEARPPLTHRHTVSSFLLEAPSPVMEEKSAPPARGEAEPTKKPLTSILSTKRRSTSQEPSPEKMLPGSRDLRDPLAELVKKTGGSKRNALLKWCQSKTQAYSGIDITNFSSSWNDGLAFCALMHIYLPQKVPYQDLLKGNDKRRNFTVAFKAAESVGIPTTLNINELVCIERPDWQAVMAYVTSIYKHFEVDR